MTKLVCRLLDKDGRLLGWCAHEAAIRGDGCLRAAGPVSMVITETGCADTLSIHWADVNVETCVAMPEAGMAVTRGAVVQVAGAGAPMIQAGEPPKRRLPPVTVDQTAVSVPVGQLGAHSVA